MASVLAQQHLDTLTVNTIRTLSIGMTTFGASALLQQLQETFGFTMAHVVEAVRTVIGKGRLEAEQNVESGFSRAGREQ